MQQSDQSFLSEWFGKTLKSDSQVETLSDDLPQIKSTQGKQIKILPPRQMLQRSPIALAEINKL